MSASAQSNDSATSTNSDTCSSDSDENVLYSLYGRNIPKGMHSKAIISTRKFRMGQKSSTGVQNVIKKSQPRVTLVCLKCGKQTDRLSQHLHQSHKIKEINEITRAVVRARSTARTVGKNMTLLFQSKINELSGGEGSQCARRWTDFLKAQGAIIVKNVKESKLPVKEKGLERDCTKRFVGDLCKSHQAAFSVSSLSRRRKDRLSGSFDIHANSVDATLMTDYECGEVVAGDMTQKSLLVDHHEQHNVCKTQRGRIIKAERELRLTKCFKEPEKCKFLMEFEVYLQRGGIKSHPYFTLGSRILAFLHQEISCEGHYPDLNLYLRRRVDLAAVFHKLRENLQKAALSPETEKIWMYALMHLCQYFVCMGTRSTLGKEQQKHFKEIDWAQMEKEISHRLKGIKKEVQIDRTQRAAERCQKKQKIPLYAEILSMVYSNESQNAVTKATAKIQIKAPGSECSDDDYRTIVRYLNVIMQLKLLQRPQTCALLTMDDISERHIERSELFVKVWLRDRGAKTAATRVQSFAFSLDEFDLLKLYVTILRPAKVKLNKHGLSELPLKQQPVFLNLRGNPMGQRQASTHVIAFQKAVQRHLPKGQQTFFSANIARHAFETSLRLLSEADWRLLNSASALLGHTMMTGDKFYVDEKAKDVNLSIGLINRWATQIKMGNDLPMSPAVPSNADLDKYIESIKNVGSSDEVRFEQSKVRESKAVFSGATALPQVTSRLPDNHYVAQPAEIDQRYGSLWKCLHGLINHGKEVRYLYYNRIEREQMQGLLQNSELDDNFLCIFFDFLSLDKGISRSWRYLHPDVSLLMLNYPERCISNSFRSWFMENGLNNVELLLMPVYLGSNILQPEEERNREIGHFCLLALDYSQKHFYYLDSTKFEYEEENLKSRRSRLWDVANVLIEARNRDQSMKDFSYFSQETIPGIFGQSLPTQSDGKSCGVFTCIFGERILRNSALCQHIGKADIREFRRELCANIEDAATLEKRNPPPRMLHSVIAPEFLLISVQIREEQARYIERLQQTSSLPSWERSLRTAETALASTTAVVSEAHLSMEEAWAALSAVTLITIKKELNNKNSSN